MIKPNMVSTRKMGQQNRKLLSQLDWFDQIIIISNMTGGNGRSFEVRKGQVDPKIISQTLTNENKLSIQTWEKNLRGRITGKVDIDVDKFGMRLGTTILAIAKFIITVTIELAVRWVNASTSRISR